MPIKKPGSLNKVILYVNFVLTFYKLTRYYLYFCLFVLFLTSNFRKNTSLTYKL